MKRVLLLRFFFAASIPLSCALSPAATLYWDADGNSTAATGGTGGWNTASTWRSGSSTGTLGDWVASSDAVLAGSAGTVSINQLPGSPPPISSVSAGAISVQTTGYVITTTTSDRALSATSILLDTNVALTLRKQNTGSIAHSLGSVSGAGTASLTLDSAVDGTNNDFRVNVSGSISVPVSVTVPGTQSSPVGIVGSSSSASVSGNITNNTTAPTMIGAATVSNSLDVSGSIGGTAGVYFGIQNGSNAGAGKVSLSASNSFTGPTSIRMNDATAGGLGVVDAKVNGALGSTSSVSITGGTLLLSGGSAVTDRISNSAPVTLGAASTNFAKIAASGTVTETFGALTLAGAGTRIIDLGTTSAILAFSSISSSTAGLALQIWNWSGSRSGGGVDRLIATSGFGSNIALSNITFYSDSGTTSLGTARWVSGTSGELVPVPEPSAFAILGVLTAVAGWRERRVRVRAS